MGKQSYAVIGLGRFGTSVAHELASGGAEVMAIDIDEEKVNDVSDIVTCAMRADACDADTMESLGLSNMDGVVIAITNSMDASIMSTIVAKEAGVPFVVAKSKDSIHTKILKKVGADKVIIPEKESGIRMARNMLAGGFLDFIEVSDRIRMIEIPIKREWVGSTLRKLSLREKKDINVVGLRRNGEVSVNPDPDMPLSSDITMLIMVDKKDVSKLI